MCNVRESHRDAKEKHTRPLDLAQVDAHPFEVSANLAQVDSHPFEVRSNLDEVDANPLEVSADLDEVCCEGFVGRQRPLTSLRFSLLSPAEETLDRRAQPTCYRLVPPFLWAERTRAARSIAAFSTARAS
jgi:hypothetical protein